MTRSKWARAWLLKRNNLSHINLRKDLTLEPGDWYNYLRIDNETYLHLHLIAPHIRKNYSAMRRICIARFRLKATFTPQKEQQLTKHIFVACKFVSWPNT
jgi:hypothetical protein